MVLLACAGLTLSSAAVGCDTDVNATLVTGINEAAVTAATALINAAFQTITPDDSTSDTTSDTTS
jgi:hypothetical protein